MTILQSYRMLFQTGAIEASSLGLWAVTFVLGGLVVVVAWLVRRHYHIAVPAYTRIFGDEDDPTADGHLATTDDRFDELSESHAELADEIDTLHDEVRKVDRRTELVLSNQNAIAEQLDADLERPRFYRTARGDVDRRDDD